MPTKASHFAALLALVSGALYGAPVGAPNQLKPTKFGTCAFTTISRVEQRLEEQNHRPVADSGSAVVLANGVYGVSYDEVPAVNQSRKGDHVMTCLVLIPTGCPPGDKRGRFYTTTNLRTMESWTLPDAEHECGGA